MPLIDPNVIAANPGQPGLVIGGASSGTVAFVATPFSGVVPAPGPIDSLVNAADMNAALRSGEEIIREVTFAGAPWRVLTLPFEGPGGRYPCSPMSAGLRR